MYQKVHVHGLLVDPIKEMPILVLKDDEDGRMLPIWIGHYEANAISLHMEKIPVPRPMTHDLLCRVLEGAGSSLEKVLIRDLQDHTYFAELVLMREGHEVHVDARPSDAVAMAVRTGSPIFVEASLYERAADVEEGDDDVDSLRRWLAKLSPEELGEYEM